jgi:hypothetical protein
LRKKARRRRHDRGRDDIGGQHPVDLVGARRNAALDIGQRDIGDRRVQRLHDDGQDDAGGDGAAIGDRRAPVADALAVTRHDFCRTSGRELGLKSGRPRAWPVSTSTTTLMPTRKRRLARRVVDADAHRNALHDLDPVAGGVLRRQQREARAEAGLMLATLPVPDGARIGVDADRRRLARLHIGQFGFLRARRDPQMVGRDQAEGLLRSRQILPGCSALTLVTMPSNGALTTCIGQVALRVVDRRLGSR